MASAPRRTTNAEAAGKQQPKHKEIIAELEECVTSSVRDLASGRARLADAEGLVEELAAAAAVTQAADEDARANVGSAVADGGGRRRFCGLCRRRRGGG